LHKVQKDIGKFKEVKPTFIIPKESPSFTFLLSSFKIYFVRPYNFLSFIKIKREG